MSNIKKGKYGETLACEYLENKGYKILDRNYKYSRYGEIDIIALDCNDTVCFIEVKTRSNDKYGLALEAITKEKLTKILLSAKNYILSKNIENKYRIDAISVTLGKKNCINHIKNIEIQI